MTAEYTNPHYFHGSDETPETCAKCGKARVGHGVQLTRPTLHDLAENLAEKAEHEIKRMSRGQNVEQKVDYPPEMMVDEPPPQLQVDKTRQMGHTRLSYELMTVEEALAANALPQIPEIPGFLPDDPGRERAIADEDADPVMRVIPAWTVVHVKGVPFYVIWPTVLEGTPGNFEAAGIK